MRSGRVALNLRGQLVSVTTTHRRPSKPNTSECHTCLQATSPVSTIWINPSQRHLFSVVDFYPGASIQTWPLRNFKTRTRPPITAAPLLVSGILEVALPCLASSQNLQQLD